MRGIPCLASTRRLRYRSGAWPLRAAISQTTVGVWERRG